MTRSILSALVAAAMLSMLASGPAGSQHGSQILSAGGSAGPSSPTVKQRFFPGVAARLSAGGRSAQSRHTITDVTMKRGIVGTAKHPDFLWLPHASHAPAKKGGSTSHVKVFDGNAGW